MFDLDKFWQFFNAEMKKSYSTVAYNAWFKNTKPISFNKKTKEMIIAVESPVAKGYWEKNLASQLIQEAYAYADMEIQPKFEVAGKEGPERLVTPQPRIKTNQEILENRRICSRPSTK